MHKELTITLFGNRQAKRCHATNRKGKQCRNAVCRGKLVCKYHGGLSTGPKTKQGRQRIAKAKTTHGKDTRQARAGHKAMIRYLHELEAEGRKLGLIVGSKSAGRKPKDYE